MGDTLKNLKEKLCGSVSGRVVLAVAITGLLGPVGLFGFAWLLSHAGYQCGYSAGMYSWEGQLYVARFALPVFFLGTIGMMRVFWGRTGDKGRL
jgi:hypothetical protein